MNNTATLRLIEPLRLDPRTLTATASVWLAAAILTVAIVSFRPFQPMGFLTQGGGASSSGDVVNQLGFGILGASALAGMLCLAPPRKLAALFSPWWLLTLTLLMFAVSASPAPDIVFRSAVFTMIGMVTMAAIVVLPRDGEGFAKVLATMSLVVLGLCYFGVVAMRSVAVHGADSIEPEHAGFWRGSFSHKNIAGPVMAFISFAGFYLYRRGWRWIGAGVFFAAMLFMAQTGSKTTAALVPASILAVAVPGLLGLRRLTVLGFYSAIAVTAIGTLGIVFISPLNSYMATNYPDFTYTGRTELWAFLGEKILERPWRGFGYESLWGSPAVLNTLPGFDQTWDIRGIVNGHNGYLDIGATLGLPGLIAALLAMIIIPARDYMRVPKLRENVYLADFFMMVLFFGSLNAFLESFFFRRAEPVWLFFFFAAFGMRYVARFPLQRRADR